ncbi:hypothetical protein K5M76_22695 (plasmid) [Shewanella xiamenensis]|uniref:Uncharacterized protein n=1 Tax=Shewanella xiamenensis TaxID=332186 RepID=A0AAE4Q384_9GAMM|nr:MULTISPECIES: hypothetical protein [Shewanella]MCT8858062.1 hypothetical protein [Shewanella xiamenensis]MDH0451070.1 hypothetical protein [Shewanella sp. GD04112]MDV5393096.1 hypothetical protein [Shewanella xiamenensis]UWG66939.1 hypothetical protein K5M76_22695 [Shewanella xiamenensis]
MELFTFLKSVSDEIIPELSKIHLAGWNGSENPLDVFLAGEFEEWQSWQSKQNFNREYIVSLIQLPEPDTWLIPCLIKLVILAFAFSTKSNLAPCLAA